MQILQIICCYLLFAVSFIHQAGEEIVTPKVLLKDLAASEGISISQASRALRTGYGVAPEIRERVLRRARELNYRNCGAHHRCKIALLTSNLGNFSQILPRLEEEFNRRQWYKFLVPCEDYEVIPELFVDGIFYFGYGRLSAKFPEMLLRYPLVEINDYSPALEECASVMPDADGEMSLALKHLAALGHRNILRLFYKLPNAPLNWQKRGIRSFFAVAEDCGLGQTVRSFLYQSEEERDRYLLQAMAEGVSAVIEGTRDPARLLHTLHEHGKRIPNDLSLITYESPNYSEWQQPSLTTLDFDYNAIAENAVALMEKSLRKRSREQVIVPSILRVRDSTGPVALLP